MKILVVDDFPTMRRIIKSLLGQLGFLNVEEAADGQAALSKLRGGDYQFVISDWEMPRMMGPELLHAVRADEELQHIPFLLLTVERRGNKPLPEANAGQAEFIVMPFSVAALEEKLRSILEHTKP
jgi:two-component system chemotaxis response regulator CheY